MIKPIASESIAGYGGYSSRASLTSLARNFRELGIRLALASPHPVIVRNVNALCGTASQGSCASGTRSITRSSSAPTRVV